MGMAASQARFLGLTARKSNVEFQGQQINQARTALTNEVMGLYSQYSKVKAPVPPSKYDYVKQTYSIDSTYENYEIKDFSKITEGPYLGYYSTTLICPEEIPRAYTNTFRDTVITAKQENVAASYTNKMYNVTLNTQKDENDDYSYIGFTYGGYNYIYDENDMGNTNIAKITGNYEDYPGLEDIMINRGINPQEAQKTYYAYMYDGKTNYIDQDFLDKLEYSQIEDMGVYNGTITSYSEEVQQNENQTYSYLNFVLGSNTFTYDANKEEGNTITKITGNYANYPGLVTIMESQGIDPTDVTVDKVYYSFDLGGISYYVSEDDLNDTAFQIEDEKEMYYGDFTFDYQGAQNTFREVQAIASITQNSSGRLTDINFIKCDDDKDLEGKQYSVTVGQVDDEDGYMDAMNQYNYEKDRYEQRLKELNAQIEKIQAQDKSLEIKLAQLDTEQEALKTEMDSVKQVIDDTVDKLFDSSK